MTENASSLPRKTKKVVVAVAWAGLAVAIVWAVLSSAPVWYDKYQAFREERRQAEAMHGRVRVLDCVDAARERLQKPIPRDTLAGIEAACAVADANR